MKEIKMTNKTPPQHPIDGLFIHFGHVEGAEKLLNDDERYVSVSAAEWLVKGLVGIEDVADKMRDELEDISDHPRADAKTKEFFDILVNSEMICGF